MRISHLFIVNLSGDIIIHKIYRDELCQDIQQKLKDKIPDIISGELSPNFEIEDRRGCHIKFNDLLLIAVSAADISSTFVTTFLIRLCGIIRDFCGEASEKLIKLNLFLIHEILEEVICQGYVQICTSDKLRSFIHSQAELPNQPDSYVELISTKLFGSNKREVLPNTIVRPTFASASVDKNEIYLDVIEKVTATIDKMGAATRMEVCGEIILQNFISGSIPLQICLNEDVTWKLFDPTESAYGSQITFVHSSFHPSVRAENVEKTNVLDVVAIPGKMSVMKYLVVDDIRLTLPFLVSVSDKQVNSGQTDLYVSVSNQFPADSYAVSFTVEIPLSPSVIKVASQLSAKSHSSDFIESDSLIRWVIKDFPGNSQQWATFQITNNNNKEPCHCGEIVLDFEISGKSMSGLKVTHLRVQKTPSSNQPSPHRYIRYVTPSDSYVCRI